MDYSDGMGVENMVGPATAFNTYDIKKRDLQYLRHASESYSHQTATLIAEHARWLDEGCGPAGGHRCQLETSHV